MARPKPIAATPEAELAGLLTTRDSLQARQTSLAAEVEQAVAARRELLIGGAEPAVIAEADGLCRQIESSAAGVADALVEVERRIRAAEQRIEARRAAAEIEQVAGGLERNAAEIEKASASLARALNEVAKAHAGLAITISGAAAGQFDPVHGPAGPVEIANSLLLQGLLKALPGLEVHAEVRPWSPYSLRAPVEGADPVAVAAEFGQRLRDTAAKVRAREIGHHLVAGEDLIRPEPFSLPEKQIFVISPFSFHRRANAPEMVTTPVSSVPWPVADRAIELGVASANETPEWRRARQPETGSHSATTSAYGWEDLVDLDFDLAAWLSDQREAA